MEPNEIDLATRDVINPVIPFFSPMFKGNIIANGGFNLAKGNAKLATNQANLVSFGRLFIANPDLPKRFEVNAPLNTANPGTFYSPSEIGYIDYPFLEEQPPDKL